MVTTRTTIPQNSPVLALLQSMLYRPVLVASLALSSLRNMEKFVQISSNILKYRTLLGAVQAPQSAQLEVLVLPPDVFPHDEEDGGADEAELDGAGEEEGSAGLVKVVHHLQHNE